MKEVAYRGIRRRLESRIMGQEKIFWDKGLLRALTISGRGEMEREGTRFSWYQVLADLDL